MPSHQKTTVESGGVMVGGTSGGSAVSGAHNHMPRIYIPSIPVIHHFLDIVKTTRR
jgi:hypothetical protein